ncbi:hypothetical protein GCM10010196_00880 [Agromyces mediolanus]|uniref:Uncharacterized protein n=1 Tax=Agromyces mediolanus TaxID=41986 RepID=A0A918F959_AGRME|nr:hypothetical protein GCM10010196_00880 [Agromyces mediolanus]GLJ73343.1 hypothetical protein GCM10017583_26010 [Agromyces mediolanus]
MFPRVRTLQTLVLAAATVSWKVSGAPNHFVAVSCEFGLSGAADRGELARVVVSEEIRREPSGAWLSAFTCLVLACEILFEAGTPSSSSRRVPERRRARLGVQQGIGSVRRDVRDWVDAVIRRGERPEHHPGTP